MYLAHTAEAGSHFLPISLFVCVCFFFFRSFGQRKVCRKVWSSSKRKLTGSLLVFQWQSKSIFPSLSSSRQECLCSVYIESPQCKKGGRDVTATPPSSSVNTLRQRPRHPHRTLNTPHEFHHWFNSLITSHVNTKNKTMFDAIIIIHGLR